MTKLTKAEPAPRRPTEAEIKRFRQKTADLGKKMVAGLNRRAIESEEWFEKWKAENRCEREQRARKARARKMPPPED